MPCKITVIIPCYNAGQYLGECIDSLKSQTIRDFEAVFVDDGSTDGTPEILKAASDDPRFSVLRRENGGVSAARNDGLNMAKGEWVFFLDADDTLAPDSLAKLLAAASNDVDLVVGMHDLFGYQEEETVYPEGLWWRMRGERRRKCAVRRLIEGDSVLNIMCNKLHRRAFLARNGIRLDERLRIAEDALFNLQAVLLARGFAFVPEVTYFYRSHPGGASRAAGESEVEKHRPWLLAMGQWLWKSGFASRFYRDYLNSVVLRFYKDGGIPKVLRCWKEEIRPLLLPPSDASVDPKGINWWAFLLIRSGLYPWIYPLLVPFQILARKGRMAVEWLDRKLFWRPENIS